MTPSTNFSENILLKNFAYRVTLREQAVTHT